MTMTEKILASSAGVQEVRAGDTVTVDVETIVMLDSTFQPARLSEERWDDVISVRHPERIAIVLDHLVPANTEMTAQAHRLARQFAARFGITRLHDVGADQGISHVIVAENGYAIPGTVLVNSDSHACALGAFNCAAIAVGRPDMVYTAVTGQTWFVAGETVRYDLHGSLRPGVSAKDVFLMIAGRWGAHTGQNIEYGGPGIASLNMNARRTIATMGTELSANFSVFEPDDLMLGYLAERNPGAVPRPTMPDPDARYVARREIDLGAVEPLVALPDGVLNQTVAIAEVEGRRIDQAFIGSCANGMLDDLEAAAQVLRGRKVAPGTRLIVTPGSQAVYLAAVRSGIVEVLMDAGAIVTPATCGACFGGNLGVLAPDEVCITASTRNFKGRMGASSAQIYMASPATVAASAIEGRIARASGYFERD
ncbi:3-isopropylmalate dehydratase large subunit [Acrocarpospora macrocephala]|nr:aconitase/3-isopropylmalate dehydratase large subunit family protein [Acrocarpospora macrocephala]